jgi:RNA-directed DNA polymerase
MLADHLIRRTLRRSHRPAERSGRSAHSEGAVIPGLEASLWEQMLSPGNLGRALKRVKANRGAPGADGMSTAEFRPWLAEHWAAVRDALDAGTYRPSPVRRVVIPKPGGGERMLGVPTCLDRLVQQAIAQVLTPVFDPHFSGSSFGFRPGRSAHQAVRVARRCIQDGLEWVADVDLDRFFDRVQFDVLMARVARKVTDRKTLRLIREYLGAGVMVGGIKQATAEGTPQGSRCRRSCRTSCWMTWTGSCGNAVTGSSAMPMIVCHER